ncbi:N66 matrix protein isoform X4 [Bradysia coprophila]|uniref:N66 matrix protein isoform X4 n=1 Tax=Bradysia coprophila TaxID=38358 RepID=UPI00187D95AA|nr:N66 matrix protein isoform X4 [Bradysia coprophila]
MEVHYFRRFICAWMVIHAALATAVNVQPLESSPKPATENLSRQARDSRYYRDERPSGRCITCAYAYDKGGDRYNDRDRDRYYNPNNYYYRPGSNRGYGQSSRGGYEDRNWYYQPDLYEDRNRYGGAGYFDNRYDDRYGQNRYDDRYYNVRPLGPSSQYDRYDVQYGGNYRGNGYDNTDPNYYYEQSRRDPYGGRERPYGGYDRYDTRGSNRDSGYDGYRQGYRGGGSVGIGYDQRNFRPWDESYSSSSGNKGSGNSHNGTGGNSGAGNRGDDTSNGYANNDRNNGQNYRKDPDTQSAPYGSYERPLRGSYLFERDSDSSASETTDSKAPETKSTVIDGETKQ